MIALLPPRHCCCRPGLGVAVPGCTRRRTGAKNASSCRASEPYPRCSKSMSDALNNKMRLVNYHLPEVRDRGRKEDAATDGSARSALAGGGGACLVNCVWLYCRPSSPLPECCRRAPHALCWHMLGQTPGRHVRRTTDVRARRDESGRSIYGGFRFAGAERTQRPRLGGEEAHRGCETAARAVGCHGCHDVARAQVRESGARFQAKQGQDVTFVIPGFNPSNSGCGVRSCRSAGPLVNRSKGREGEGRNPLLADPFLRDGHPHTRMSMARWPRPSRRSSTLPSMTMPSETSFSRRHLRRKIVTGPVEVWQTKAGATSMLSIDRRRRRCACAWVLAPEALRRNRNKCLKCLQYPAYQCIDDPHSSPNKQFIIHEKEYRTVTPESMRVLKCPADTGPRPGPPVPLWTCC